MEVSCKRLERQQMAWSKNKSACMEVLREGRGWGGGVWGVGGEGPYKSIPAGKKADLSICDLFTI